MLFRSLGEEVRAVMQAGADIVHVDIMDGHFVPNISFGPAVMGSIRGVTEKPFDVHLMISPVDAYLGEFAKNGADYISVHVEAGPHLHRTIQEIKRHGKKAGVVLNPATPPQVIDHVGVVHDFVTHVNGRAKFVQRTLDDVDGAIHPGTKTAGFGEQNFFGHGGVHKMPMMRTSKVTGWSASG